MRTWLILRYDKFKQPDPIWLMCFCVFVNASSIQHWLLLSMVMLIVHVATIERAKWDNQPQNCIYIYNNPLWQGILAATGHI